MNRLESRALHTISVGAWCVATLLVGILAVRVATTLLQPTVLFHGVPLANGAAVSFLEEQPDVVGARYETAWMEIAAPPGQVRWLTVAALVLGAMLGIGISVVIAVLARRVREGRPFARSATLAVGTAAILVLISGVIAPLIGAIGEAELVRFLGDDVVGAARDTGFGREGLYLFGVAIDLTPFGWALALAVVAAAFEMGQRMQRDTEGLV